MTLTALDLFAGTGWGVAAQRLGIEEHGVEIMPEARASRDAAGMSTVFADVWDGLADPSIVPAHRLLIASPPCQTFSVAGKGAGRRALDEVLGLIRSRTFTLPGAGLRDSATAQGLDDRTALVLSPLAYIWQHEPTYVALEQVPSVLPVWEAIAEVLRSDRGYSVVTGVLNAEQYGVPQTRKRAILIARRDGITAAMPTPTHSRYYSRDPQRLDEGVLPWVSMAEALGWDDVAAAAQARVVDQSGTAWHGTTAKERAAYALALVPEGGDWRDLPDDIARDVMGGAYESGGGRTGYFRRLHRDRPAPTIVGSPSQKSTFLGHPTEPRAINEDEAKVIQTYPAPFPFQGTQTKRFLQIGNAVPPLLAQHILATFL